MKSRVACCFLFATLLGGATSKTGENPTSGADRAASGEGVLCAAAIYNGAEEVGRRCFPGKDAGFKAELADSIRMLDAFILRDADWTRARLDAFKKQQSVADGDDEKLCRGDVAYIYRKLASVRAGEVRASVKELIARSGKPAWGDCL